MSVERRCQEDEVRKILDLVARRAEIERPALPEEGGLAARVCVDVVPDKLPAGRSTGGAARWT